MLKKLLHKLLPANKYHAQPKVEEKKSYALENCPTLNPTPLKK